MRRLSPDYLRSIIFGFEDSLVSTTGVIAGVSIGTQDSKVILLAGAVAIAVEALSMGAGQFPSRTRHFSLTPTFYIRREMKPLIV